MRKTSSKKRAKSKKLNPALKKKLIFEALILLIYAIMIAAICIVLFIFDLPQKSVYYIILTVLGISSLCGGYIIGKKEKKNGLVVGVVYNILPCVIILLVSLLLNSFAFNYRLLVTALIMLIFSAVGGITAVNTRNKSR